MNIEFGNPIINFGLIAAIIILTTMIKAVIRKIDPKERLSRFYVLIPLMLGCAVAPFVAVPFTWQNVGLNAIIYAALAAYFYKVGKKFSFGGVEVDPTNMG